MYNYLSDILGRTEKEEIDFIWFFLDIWENILPITVGFVSFTV